MGDHGTGHLVKSLNNLLSATTLASAAEAALLAEKAGVPLELFVQIMNASNGRSYSTEVKFPSYVLDRSFDDGFALGLMVKDLKIASQTAAEFGFPMPVGSALTQLWQAADAGGTARRATPRSTPSSRSTSGVEETGGDGSLPGRASRNGDGSRPGARPSRRTPNSARSGAGAPLDLALVADGETVLLRLREGRIAAFVRDPGMSDSWSVTLRGRTDDWLTFLQPEPPPFYNDLLAMNSRVPSFSIEGDRRSFVRHLRCLTRLFRVAQLVDGRA